MGRLFGTDGIRGTAVTELTCELAMHTGRAMAVVLGRRSKRRVRIIVGKDTRISSDVIESALCAGILSAGADAVLLGTVPTPAVAHLVRARTASGGVMITASHRSVGYNGLRLFSETGYRLPDDIENEIEALVYDSEGIEKAAVSSSKLGRLIHDEKAAEDYARHILSTVSTDFGGMRIAIDCANGSACSTVERIFSRRGAQIYLLNRAPDGMNINEKCGTVNTDMLRKFVTDNKCTLGLAFDGDAGRCIAVDEKGAVVDGDRLTAIFSKDLKERGLLNKDTAVVSAMTNMGFGKFAEANGINVVTTKVGDRYILEQMIRDDYSIGGEQSGYIIFGSYASTGDGELTAVQLLSLMRRTGKRLSELAAVMERYPQVMINVRIAEKWKEAWKNIPRIEELIGRHQETLGTAGRILVRESGTEPFIRVMIEGRQFDLVNRMAVEIADRIRECCPGE
ncbi:MAG: phosphoglucosamine mutase [Oscillospiraceae bacterium]|nr:phosphoglucosamine mutase [Oscillospiraceae bacterium]